MEVGPITGVRAVSLLNVKRTGDAQPPVFEIDSSARAGDEAYSPSHQTPDRGLEEEDSGIAEDDATQPETPSMPSGNHPRVSFFA